MFRTFDPFREFTPITRSFGPTVDTEPEYDIIRSDEGVQLFVDLPGVDPAGVDLTVDGRSLQLVAERTFDVPEGATLVSRRRHGRKISHRFHLGENLDAERLEADYAFGVLKVTIPVSDAARPRKVAVGVGSAGAIDTVADEAS